MTNYNNKASMYICVFIVLSRMFSRLHLPLTNATFTVTLKLRLIYPTSFLLLFNDNISF